MLQQFRIEKGERVFKRIRLGSGYGPFDRRGVKAMRDQPRDQEIDGVLQAASVVASVSKHQTRLILATFLTGLGDFAEMQVDLVLALQLLLAFDIKVFGSEKGLQIGIRGHHNFMAFRNHALSTGQP